VNNPVLCDADRVTVNAHAFYDRNTVAGNSGNFILNTVLPAIKKACAPYGAVKHIVITESGWPSRGPANGAAVASTGNEQSALSGLNCASRTVGIMAFEIDDSVWKQANDNEKSMCLPFFRYPICAEDGSRFWDYWEIRGESWYSVLCLLIWTISCIL
jgi:exo-beta-1,3-glucanase (GH17 family)